MGNESLGDLIKKLAGATGNNTTTTTNEPIFKVKSVSEGQNLVPDFKSVTEFFEKKEK